MAQRLRGLGMLKRQADPEPAYLSELLRTSVSRLICPQCEGSGLLLEAMPEDEWNSARLCESCDRPIARERLEALPTATRCAACQSTSDSGSHSEGEAEYCPRCGAIMQLRAAGGSGLARYVSICPDCGR